MNSHNNFVFENVIILLLILLLHGLDWVLFFSTRRNDNFQCFSVFLVVWTNWLFAATTTTTICQSAKKHSNKFSLFITNHHHHFMIDFEFLQFFHLYPKIIPCLSHELSLFHLSFSHFKHNNKNHLSTPCLPCLFEKKKISWFNFYFTFLSLLFSITPEK